MKAKEHLLRYIDNFVVERIKAAASLITEEAMKQNIIQDGDIIMTYGKQVAITAVAPLFSDIQC